MGIGYRFNVLQKLEHYGVVPTVNATSIEDYLAITEALVEGGLPIIEMCFRESNKTPARVTLDAIYETRKKFGENVLVGSGTTQNAPRVQAAIDSGAQFIVSNITHEGVIQTAHENDTLVIPGARTDTEVEVARKLGCLAVKILLPAGDTTDGEILYFFKNFFLLFPKMVFVPTAGITPQNIGQFYKLGAPFVAYGRVVPTEAVVKKDWRKITEATKAFLATIYESRTTIIKGGGDG